MLMCTAITTETLINFIGVPHSIDPTIVQSCHPCSTFCCCVKHTGENKPKKDFICPTLPGYGSSLKIVKAGSPRQKAWMNADCWIDHGLRLTITFLILPRTPAQGMVPSIVGCALHQLVIKAIPHRHAHRLVLLG